MVQSQLIEPFDTTVVPLMSEQEARECENEIISAGNTIRSKVLEFYERRGWVALGYGSVREWMDEVSQRTFGISRVHLLRELLAGQVEQNLVPMGTNIGSIPERQLRPLTNLDPADQPMAWQEANERSNGKPTARVVEEVVKEMRGDDDALDPPMEPAQAADILRAERAPRVNAGLYSSATPEWYTPEKIVDRVVAVFGQIDLDPCSNSDDWREAAIPAEAYYTKDNDGLAQPWSGHVYMNPPYGDEIATWVDRLVRAYTSGEITDAIALLPARTDTAWFQPLFDYTICFVRGRLRFSGSDNSAPFPSAVVYLGNDTALFNDSFQDIGRIK